MKAHIFLNVIERRYNPFSKIFPTLDVGSEDIVLQSKLDAETLETILEVEYSWKRRYRFFYYGKAFKSVKRALGQSLDEVSSADEVLIYITDEGVFSEIVLHAVKKLGSSKKIKYVMVQHGLHYLEEPPANLKIRKFANMLSITLLGFPAFGYGFVGSNLDVYFVYTKSDKDFIEERLNSTVVVCPKTLKQDFLLEFEALEIEQLKQDEGIILFAMEPVTPASGVKGSEFEVYESMSEFVFRVSELTRKTIVFRPHPGSNREDVLSMISQLSYCELIEVDVSPSLNEALVRSDFVMSIHSTVLFDALLVGKVPIQVVSDFEDRVLHLDQELIDLRALESSELSRIFSDENKLKFLRKSHSADEDWMAALV